MHFNFYAPSADQLKFILSEKATKNDQIFTVDLALTKGQLISKQIYEVIVFPKKQTKYCKDFCPNIQGRNLCNISFAFWEKR